ncbi:MAG: hypothetical protein ABIP12_06065 [Terriglobales bacterium]
MTIRFKLRRCPECSSTGIRRSRPMSWRERYFFPKIFLLPYRCEDCSRRFYGFRFFRRTATSRFA